MVMNIIIVNIIIGFFLMPGLLFLAATLLTGYRQRQGLAPLPPDKVSLMILLLTLLSWAVAGFNIFIRLLQ
jgi:hypothetical protein